MRIVLASQSKRRQQALRNAGYDFDVVVSNFDESQVRDDDPAALVQKLAAAKARAVAAQLSAPAIVIGADTVVVFNGNIREKPTSVSEAREFLESYRNAVVGAVNGIAVIHSATGECRTGTDSTDTYFGDIPDATIDQLVGSKIVFEWAGGYYPADPILAPCIEKVVSKPGSANGLPLKILEQLIDEVS